MRPVDELPYIEYEPDSGGTVRIYADAWESEGLRFPALVTEHAVETGSTMSDHYLPQPITGRCQLFFSDSPIRGDLDPEFEGRIKQQDLNIPEYPVLTPLFTPRGLTSGVVNAVSGLLGVGGSGLPKSFSAMAFDTPPNRLRKTLQTLLELREKRTLVAIGFSVLRVENLAIVEAEIERNAQSGDGGAIVLNVTQIQFTQTDVAVAVPLPLEPRGQAKKTANAGGTTPVETEKGSVVTGVLKSVGVIK